MCFYVSDKYPNERIAKRDIICYKILFVDRFSTIISPIQLKIYRLNYKYKLRKKLEVIYWYGSNIRVIYEGFHSFSSKKLAKSLLCREPCLIPNYTKNIFKCIIPKGACYYYDNVNQEYVSNQIIIKERIK